MNNLSLFEYLMKHMSNTTKTINDYWKRDNLFSLRYCNWDKDLFMGILPNSQFGDIAVVDVSGRTGYSDVRIGSSGLTVQNFAAIDSDSSFLVSPSSAPSSSIPWPIS